MSLVPDPRLARLVDHLAGQRRHVLGALEGLDEEKAARPVLPSGWSCLSLVNHLASDVEVFWFQAIVAGDPAAIAALEAAEHDGWTLPAGATTSSVVGAYRAAAERADAILRAGSADAPPAWWPPFFGDWRLEDVGEVVLHVITETATHAGHLDAARELLDGRTWLVVG